MRTSSTLLHRGSVGTVLEHSRAKGSDWQHLAPGSGETRTRPSLLKRLQALLLLMSGLLALGLGLHLLSPMLARSLAANLPTNWIHGSSERVLARLDGSLLRPSQSDAARQTDLRKRFANLNAPTTGAPPYRLVFRQGGSASPLLFSLPSGDIVVTDAFFTHEPDPVTQLALLCQQLGHLHHQHALHNAIELKLLRLATAALAGSAEHSIGALTEGLQRVEYTLPQLQEADRYAAAMLAANRIAPGVLQGLLSEHGENGAVGQFSSPERLPAYTEARRYVLMLQQ
ncbi:hypothetical protein [Uliginosibacterium sp. 31-12]|uniref:hypothetical protein n=1 Tax=Uliginosibacterium sp. 31-12 TaxID=3062781 RepID=UPI0026E12767|nr:hypothetical protein [Uliginosibacterium sp. 31-12]MDO6387098.1 hypothetical protein [Uliginosibacterium sp. 31-12]